jgi:hypothetical protein
MYPNPLSRLAPVCAMSGTAIAANAVEGTSWLWNSYLAFGAVSVLDGDPNVGKSLLAIDLAARIGTGRPMPDGSPPARDPLGRDRLPYTIYISGDDGSRRTILPRYLAAGGDPDRIVFLGGIDEDHIDKRPLTFPKELPLLYGVIRPDTGHPGAFVVIDPISAIYPKAVAGGDSTVRAALDPLIRIAASSRSCILIVRHLNKSAGRRSLYRGGGSIGVVGACRTALLAAVHPDDPQRRVVSMTKCNLGRPGPSLTYRVETAQEKQFRYEYLPGEKHPETGKKLKEALVIERTIPAGPVIHWEGPTPITADELVSIPPDLGAQSARAAEWLKALLASGPVRATVIEAKAHEDGLGYRTVCSAKARLKIDSRRVISNGEAYWEWMLPDDVATGHAAMK